MTKEALRDHGGGPAEVATFEEVLKKIQGVPTLHAEYKATGCSLNDFVQDAAIRSRLEQLVGADVLREGLYGEELAFRAITERWRAEYAAAHSPK